jgi:hypothetical protein
MVEEKCHSRVGGGGGGGVVAGEEVESFAKWKRLFGRMRQRRVRTPPTHHHSILYTSRLVFLAMSELYDYTIPSLQMPSVRTLCSQAKSSSMTQVKISFCASFFAFCAVIGVCKQNKRQRL